MVSRRALALLAAGLSLASLCGCAVLEEAVIQSRSPYEEVRGRADQVMQLLSPHVDDTDVDMTVEETACLDPGREDLVTAETKFFATISDGGTWQVIDEVVAALEDAHWTVLLDERHSIMSETDGRPGRGVLIVPPGVKDDRSGIVLDYRTVLPDRLTIAITASCAEESGVPAPTPNSD